MKYLGLTTLIILLVITTFLLFIAFNITNRLDFIQPNSKQMTYYQFDLDIFKSILIGFLVAILGILIPTMIAESHHNFQRLKESRIAYSKAKTGVDYLALRLCTLKLSEASKIIQEVHFQKHQAVLYPEFKQHLKDRFDDTITKDQWDKAIYRKLRDTRLLLKNHASEWDTLKPNERLELLEPFLKDIDETDEKTNENDLLKNYHSLFDNIGNLSEPGIQELE